MVPSFLSIVSTVLVTLWILEDISRQVAPNPSTVCLTPLVILGLLADYGVRLVNLVNSPKTPGAADSAPKRRWRWFALPVCLALVASAEVEPWPMTVRFALSRSAFAEAADGKRVIVLNEPQWIGFYLVVPLSRTRLMTGASAADPVGFEYDPTHPEPHWLRRDLGGDWYAVEW